VIEDGQTVQVGLQAMMVGRGQSSINRRALATSDCGVIVYLAPAVTTTTNSFFDQITQRTKDDSDAEVNTTAIMPPARTKKDRASGPSKAVAIQSPNTPTERESRQQAPSITEAQKQALMDNLQLESTLRSMGGSVHVKT